MIKPILESHQRRDEQVAALSTRLGITTGALESFFATLGEQGVPEENWPQKLSEIAQRHLALREQLESIRADDAETQRKKAEANAAIDRGDLTETDRLLAELVDIYLRAADAATETMKASHLQASEAQTARADVAMIQLDYPAAAQHFQRAAELVGDLDRDARDRCVHQSAFALYTQGDEKGDNAALKEAIRLFRQVLHQLNREADPLDWATTQNNLGNALTSLGERESGTARLEEAVAAYREALQEYTRERVPLDWAMTQNNLGNALTSLAERENGTARLEEAVAGYRSALEERTRERVPLDWAMTQNNLGNALRSLGERESGTARLEEAVSAYREALKEYTRERVPLQWATTQNNLGTALLSLGKRERGSARLEEAVVAYRAALEIFEATDASHYIAGTRKNLRITEQLIEQRRPGHDE